jgi:hypothetical protein
MCLSCLQKVLTSSSMSNSPSQNYFNRNSAVNFRDLRKDPGTQTPAKTSLCRSSQKICIYSSPSAVLALLQTTLTTLMPKSCTHTRHVFFLPPKVIEATLHVLTSPFENDYNCKSIAKLRMGKTVVLASLKTRRRSRRMTATSRALSIYPPLRCCVLTSSTYSLSHNTKKANSKTTCVFPAPCKTNNYTLPWTC